MQEWTKRSLFVASTALTLSLATFAANANPALQVGSNLLFTDCNGGGPNTCSPKGSFTSVNPTGWTGGGGLIFIDGQTPGTRAADPVYLTTYGNPGGSVPGNYVEADGNPFYESSFHRVLTGLTPGQPYDLSFYQGASQQKGFVGDTTNQWIVSLASAPLDVEKTTAPGVHNNSCGTQCAYFDTDPHASIAASDLMTVPSGSTVGWDQTTVTLTPFASTEVLSFLAWGDNGNTNNLPPIAFLSGIGEPPGEGVPEPASLALLGVGLAGLGGVVRRRRGKRSTSA